MVIYVGVFQVKAGTRAEFLEEVKKADLLNSFRKQPGCIYYYLEEAAIGENLVIMTDGWRDKAAHNAHCSSPEIAGPFMELFGKYIEKEVASNNYDL